MVVIQRSLAQYFLVHILQTYYTFARSVQPTKQHTLFSIACWNKAHKIQLGAKFSVETVQCAAHSLLLQATTVHLTNNIIKACLICQNASSAKYTVDMLHAESQCSNKRHD